TKPNPQKRKGRGRGRGRESSLCIIHSIFTHQKQRKLQTFLYTLSLSRLQI
ncbi:unnamed protein product, partial [Brassica oleracea]